MSAPLDTRTPAVPFFLLGSGGSPELDVRDGVSAGDALNHAIAFLKMINRDLSNIASVMDGRPQPPELSESVLTAVYHANLATAFVCAAEAGLTAADAARRRGAAEPAKHSGS